MTSAARYRFSDGARVGVLLGMSMRQALPIVIGVLWLTLMLMAGIPIVGMLGPIVGVVVALGRWKRAPLYEVAAPGLRLVTARLTKRSTWTRRSLLAAGPGVADDLPPALQGLELHEFTVPWRPSERAIGVVRDRPAGTVSVVFPIRGEGFPVASATEQDALLASWGTVLAPIARARCPVSRVTWQEWSHPVGVDAHRTFLCGSWPRPTTQRCEHRLRVAARFRCAVHGLARRSADRDGRPPARARPARSITADCSR